MCIMENLAVVTYYDLQELLNVSTCATSVNVRDFNAKTMCPGAYSILVLSFFFFKYYWEALLFLQNQKSQKCVFIGRILKLDF